MTTDAGDLLKAGIEELGLKYSEKQIKAFLEYLSELKKWNKAYNLTGLKSDRDIIIKHFLDSLLFAGVLPPGALTLADIGSGAGFPGIPIKIIFPCLKVFLVEPTQKKAIFLRHVCSRLQLRNIEIIDRRLEDIKDLKVDVAVTRALYSIGEFIEKTKDILNEKGILILSKGPKYKEELQRQESQNIAVRACRLPFEEIIRYFVIIR